MTGCDERITMEKTGFKIISDSCCDLPKDYCEANDIGIVPLYVAFEDGVYKRDYLDFTYHEFYQKMLDNPGNFPKTSLPGPEDYINVFKPFVEAGEGILCLCMTTTMSGSYNSAKAAVDALRDDFPDADIEVVDTKALTIFQGLLAKEAVRLRSMGKSLSETADIIRRIKSDGGAFFTIGDLTYLNKGGRIGGLVKLAAIGLGLKPVIYFKEGIISLAAITRSRKKSLSELAKQTAAFFAKTKAKLEDYELLVGYGLSKEDGLELKTLFVNALKKVGYDRDPELVQIGTMVGAHNGPYLMGIVFMKRYSEQ